jgi:uncharacterized phage-like protein YoqJ
MDKKKSACCFIGHRVVPNAIYSDIAYQTECKVFDYISQGFIDFYVGGLTGYDLIASLAVINAKRIFPHARLNLVLPLEDQVAKAKKHDNDIHEKILSNADHIEYVSEHCKKVSKDINSHQLVDCSSMCICYLYDDIDDTASKVEYTKKEGLRVINVAEEKEWIRL